MFLQCNRSLRGQLCVGTVQDHYYENIASKVKYFIINLYIFTYHSSYYGSTRAQTEHREITLSRLNA